jgi:hypothetical protein
MIQEVETDFVMTTQEHIGIRGDAEASSYKTWPDGKPRAISSDSGLLVQLCGG